MTNLTKLNGYVIVQELIREEKNQDSIKEASSLSRMNSEWLRNKKSCHNIIIWKEKKD